HRAPTYDSRANICCGPECARQRRLESKRVNNARYQRTRRGARKHAARQARYRAEKSKVTGQGSPEAPLVDTLVTSTAETNTVVKENDHDDDGNLQGGTALAPERSPTAGDADGRRHRQGSAESEPSPPAS